MSVPSSVDDLIQLVRKSGMVDDSRLTTYLQERKAGNPLPAEPREAADAFVDDGILTHFQAEQFMLGKWKGFTVGKYKLLERVGVGGMGQVFLCEHMFLKRRVAIKVLPPSKAEQPAALGRFYREARAAAALAHPSIVRTHDIDQDGNLHFIVMEYVDGSNLLDIVKKFGRVDIGRAVSYSRQVAAGLEYAFRNGIIHRDIKPGNVLIDRKGRARILDMGLARFFKDQTDNLTVQYDDKIVLGTADYVAPEQVANSHSVDIRADIYGLGATLYFLLAGHPPFPTGTVSQKLLWHRTKDPTPIRSLRPEVPEGLAAVLARMMTKNPAARYQSPGELLSALEPFQPAEVPLPAIDEMPVLSKAALEGMPAEEEMAEECLLQTSAAGNGSRALPAGGMSQSRPVTPPFGASFDSPSRQSGAVGTVDGVSRELRRPPTSTPGNSSSPWAACADTPSALSEKTPIEAHPAKARVPFVVSRVSGGYSDRRRSYAILAGAAAAVVLASGGLCLWLLSK